MYSHIHYDCSDNCRSPPPQQQGVAITGRNRTGPPCSVGNVPSLAAADRPHARPACSPAVSQTMTDAREQNNTGPLGGPVIMNAKIAKLC